MEDNRIWPQSSVKMAEQDDSYKVPNPGIGTQPVLVNECQVGSQDTIDNFQMYAVFNVSSLPPYSFDY